MKVPLLSRVAAVRLAFNPTQPSHVSCRLFYHALDNDKLRGAFPTAKIIASIEDTVTEPSVEVEFVNGEKLALTTSKLSMNEIQERIQRAIRRVINSEP